MQGDQDILNVVMNVCRGLRRDRTFCDLLHKLTDKEARDVARSFVDWIYVALQNEDK
jgi:hypothetical protein